jgi:hypothetical protein
MTRQCTWRSLQIHLGRLDKQYVIDSINLSLIFKLGISFHSIIIIIIIIAIDINIIIITQNSVFFDVRCQTPLISRIRRAAAGVHQEGHILLILKIIIRPSSTIIVTTILPYLLEVEVPFGISTWIPPITSLTNPVNFWLEYIHRRM